jgi:hypothetical protein
VSGTLLPSTGYAYHGGTATEIEVDLMPAEYNNYQTKKFSTGYRLIFGDSTAGSENTFEFISKGTDYYGQTIDLDDDSLSVTASGSYSSLIVENGFVDTSTDNTVSLTVRMPLTTSKLSIEISDISTFQDFVSQLGGLFGAIGGIFIVVMHYVERGYDKEDAIGQLRATMSVEMTHMKEKLHEAMYPEPEVWRMDNIARMERREKKKSGQEEDEAVKNFKDLLERSKGEARGDGMQDEYEDDEEAGGAADYGRL